MVGRALKHPNELHNIILEGTTIERKKTAERSQNSYYTKQFIKCDARVKTFKELEENYRS